MEVNKMSDVATATTSDIEKLQNEIRKIRKAIKDIRKKLESDD